MTEAARPAALPATTRAERGFTLLELGLVLALIGLLAALVVPRLGLLSSAALETSTRRLATRLHYLREDAARRGRFIRVVVDPHGNAYRAEVLADTTSGPHFVADPNPLYRTITLPSGITVAVAGLGVTNTPDGLPMFVFAPDGYADPAVIQVADESGRTLSVVIEPVMPRPRVIEGPVQPLAVSRP